MSKSFISAFVKIKTELVLANASGYLQRKHRKISEELPIIFIAPACLPRSSNIKICCISYLLLVENSFNKSLLFANNGPTISLNLQSK